MNDRDTKIKTYILKTIDGEYYCGKTMDLDKRLREHLIEKSPCWFSLLNRRNFELISILHGNFEKEIKRFGVRRFYEAINKVSLS